MHTDNVQSTTHYSQFVPTRMLTPFVACYWTITGADENPATRIRVLPDGCMDIIFDFIGSIRFTEPPQDTNYTSFMVGIHEASMVEFLPATPKMLGIRFRPGAVTSLLGFSAPEFSESHVNLDSILPDFSRLVFSYAGAMNTPRKMVAVVERLLLERLGSLPDSHSLTRQVVTNLWKSRAHHSINRLADAMGIHQRKLERTLRAHTGLTPKQLGRTMRFVSATRSLHANPHQSLASLALDLGYTDQPHFTREFKRMAGLSPTRWLKECQSVDFLQYTPVPLM